MKNKVELKKCLVRIVMVIVLFGIFTVMLHQLEYARYQREYNETLGRIFTELKEQYPDLSETEFISILSDDEESEEAEAFMEKYGIDPAKDSAIRQNEKNHILFLLGWIALILGLAGSILVLFLTYNRRKDKELQEITRYIEQINQKNYTLEMESMSEDELSMLKTEIYKTTVMLKEVAENSSKDKANLKDALSDISHQMKTPLTSILVILDNLIDDPDMDPDLRQDFIRDIKREISHIQFLVQALLKMTKLDAGTVTFFRENVSLREIGQEAIQNVSSLCDLKDVKVETDFAEDDIIYCDYRWQAEAITNILKNCVEHAPAGSKVILKTVKNQVYGSISITDFGPGIDAEDLKHLFERFYRGKNASADGVGIGLSLAKTIVESDKGRIFVESSEKKTVFDVKYFI